MFFLEPIFIGFMISFFSCLLLMSRPILIKTIIQYTSYEDRNTGTGVMYICLIVLSQLLMSILDSHSSFVFVNSHENLLKLSENIRIIIFFFVTDWIRLRSDKYSKCGFVLQIPSILVTQHRQIQTWRTNQFTLS